MPCSFINFPSGFLSVSTSVTAIVAGDLRLKMTCETTWGKHRPVTTTSDPTQHLSGYVPSCARRQKWPIQCSQQSCLTQSPSRLEAQQIAAESKKLQVKVRWTVNTGSMIYGTAAFFIFPCSAVKQLAIPLSGKCCQRSDSGRAIHQTDLEPASWKPPGVPNIFTHNLRPAETNHALLHYHSIHKWESQHIGSPWPTVHNIDRRYNELHPPSHPSLLRWCNWTIGFVNDMV